MPRYKLTYFDVMGLGEPIRFLLSYGGHEFVDVRVDRATDWPEMKPTTPFGQLPLLEIDGKAYPQTLPICRYLAKEMDLLGKTVLDALEIDGIANALYDLRKAVAMFFRETDPIIRQKRKKETVGTVVPFFMNKFEKLAEANKGYLYGAELSYADIFFVAIHDSLAHACQMDITENRPHLKALREKILDIPNIKKWIEKRPNLDF